MNTTVKHLENILLSLKVIDVIKPSVSASASYGGDEGEDEEEGDERRFRSIRVDKAAASAKRNEEDDDDWD